MTTQHLINGSTVYVQGHEMIVSDLRIVEIQGQLRASFKGTCTNDKGNDSIRHTMYNGGTYGGNKFVYSW